MQYDNYYDEMAAMAKEQEEQEQAIAAMSEQEAAYDRLNEMREAMAMPTYTPPQLPAKVTLTTRKDYKAAAYQWLRDMGNWQGYPTVLNVDTSWYVWVGTHWVPVREEDVTDMLRPYFDLAVVGEAEKEEALYPNNSWMRNVVEALRSLVRGRISDIGVATWMAQLPNYPNKANEYIAMRNGLLHWPSRRLYPHTPAYWSLGSLPHDWRHGLGVPTALIKVLNDQFANDPQAVMSIQEMCGYIIVGGRELEKAFALIGAPRSGKSTLADALAQAVGTANAPSISMTDTSDFALSRLLGSRLVLIPDARAARSSNKITELILNITGQDTVTIHRKYQAPISTKIAANVLLHSNELPGFFDASGAIASRFILFEFRNSYLGKEDPHLKDKVRSQIPEFIAWALQGYDRLRQRGYIVVPQSSQHLVELMHESASDIGRFLAEYGYEVTGNDADKVIYDDIYEKYVEWSEAEHIPIPSKQKMYKNLKAYAPSVTKKKNAVSYPGGGRKTAILGLKKD